MKGFTSLKSKDFFCLCFLFLYFFLYSFIALANKEIKTFLVGTEIDKSRMLANNLTQFELVPRQVSLMYSSTLETFEDLDLELTIGTDFPTESTSVSGYELIIKDNISVCYQKYETDPSKLVEEVGYSDLAKVYFDGSANEWVAGVSQKIANFNITDTSLKSSTHQIKLKFNKITSQNVSYCSGSFSVMFRFDA